MYLLGIESKAISRPNKSRSQRLYREKEDERFEIAQCQNRLINFQINFD
jgi:hypothetical protein